MKVLVLSALCAFYLYGATDSQSIVGEVSKLRQKYEECRQGQPNINGVDPKIYAQCDLERKESLRKVKGYQSRIATLEAHIKNIEKELSGITAKNSELQKELAQKSGVIQSLEKTLTSRDAGYREAVALNDKLSKEANAVKVSKIERASLQKALEAAKEEVRQLQIELKKAQVTRNELQKSLEMARAGKNPPVAASKTPPAVNGTASDAKIAALQSELSKANALIAQLQKTPVKSPESSERIKALQAELASAQATIANLKNTPAAKVVYKDRPVVQEKVITKVVEPTEKIKALQSELAAAQATIVNLKSAGGAKVVYKDRPVEKVVYKDRIVTQEKVVYKERPVVQEKVVTKVVEPTEKIKALEAKLAQSEQQITKLRTISAATASENTKRQLDKLSLELERQKSVNEKLKADLDTLQTRRLASAARTSPVPAKNSVASATSLKPTVSTVSSQPLSAPAKKGASAYRMAADATIYDAPNGRVVDKWEARRSFTAGAPSGGWVHITGYFVNRVWQSTREDEHLWVRESDVIRR